MSARYARAVWLFGMLAAASACKTGPTQTQVIVLIDAEHDVRARTAKLQVDVYSEDDAKKSISESLTPKWPVELALAPKDHDASRTYRVSAEARDKGGETVAVARLVSGYVDGEKLFVILELEDACIDSPSACEDASDTCHEGACVSAHVDAKRFATSRDDAPVAGELLSASDAGTDTHEDGGPEGDGGQPGQSEPGLGEPGDPCSTAGERSCSGHASTVPLICRAGQWEVGQVCKNDERCDSAKGETLGHCRPIADECKGQHPQEAFCSEDAIRECVDLVSFEDRPCQDHATCADKSGDASCVCKAGFSAKGADCIDIDECKTENGGCDSAAECKNTAGSRKCGACPEGYTGTGESGCIPLLLDLALSQGALSPAFDSHTDSYELQLPLGAQTFELTPSLPEGTVLEIDGTEIASDDTWTSPVLDLGSNTIELKLIHDDQEVVYMLHVERGSTIDYIKASNTGANDQFGWSVAISSGTLVVGAPVEDSAATGVNNTVVGQDNEAAIDSGAAYVFVRSKGSWKQQAYLKASNTDASDQFGYSVAISGDTIVVGAIGEASSYTGVNPDNGQEDDTQAYAGAAYVFVREAGEWHQQAYLKASNAQGSDDFGWSVALSGDTIVVGALAESSIFAGVNGTPADQADNMASLAGAAYVFTRSNGTWVQDAYLKASNSEASDQFGVSVAVSGDTIVVGAAYEDSSTPGPRSTSGGSNNDASGSGAAYVFVRKAGGWQQEAYLKAVNPGAGDVFGYSVSISDDTIAVGANGEASASTGIDDITPGPMDDSASSSGAAYIFVRSGSTWEQQAYLKASNTGTGDNFGYSVAVSGDTVVVGAIGESSAGTGINNEDPGQDDNNSSISGAAYLFTRNGDKWKQEAYLKAHNSETGDEYGYSVAVSGGFVIIGSYGEGSAATGVNNKNPGPGDNTADNASAVYAY